MNDLPKAITVRQLQQALAKLQPDDLVGVNGVRNLYVKRKEGKQNVQVGFIDFINGSWNPYEVEGDE